MNESESPLLDNSLFTIRVPSRIYASLSCFKLVNKVDLGIKGHSAKGFVGVSAFSISSLTLIQATCMYTASLYYRAVSFTVMRVPTFYRFKPGKRKLTDSSNKTINLESAERCACVRKYSK